MRKMVVVIAAACLMVLPVAYGQAQKAHPEHNQTAVENRVEHHVMYLTTVLSLSSPQQQQAKSILMDTTNENRSLFADIRTTRKDLRAAVQKDEPATKIKELSDKIGNDVSKLAMNEASAGKQLNKILNPEQRTKLAALQNENFGRFGMGWGVNG